MLKPGGGDGCVGVLVGGCVGWVGWLDGNRRGCREPGAGRRVRGGRRERGGHDGDVAGVCTRCVREVAPQLS